MFLVADLIIALALASLSFRSGTSAGIWVWVLVIPALGKLPLLRFDMIPTAFAVTGLVLPAWRWRNEVVGALIGMGVAVKAWPIVLLLSVGSRKDVRAVLLAAGATILLVIVATSFWLDGTLNFLGNQSGRGLQIESVAASPWYANQAVVGQGVEWTGGRNGAPEIISPWADLLASLLRIAMACLGIACVVWWFLWTRDETSIDPERRTAIGRDAVFTAILLYIVLSPVLSPQYLIWAVGIGAVAVCSRHSRVHRPVGAVVVSVLLTQTLLATWGDLVNNGAGGAYILVVRNLVLVFAALDAAWTVWQVAWNPDHFKSEQVNNATLRN
jgi:hypothetical protein